MHSGNRQHSGTSQHPGAVATPSQHEQPSLAGRTSWSVLVLLCVAQFMVILDMTVVNVALPSIGRSLHFADTDLQWVITTYLLFTGGLMLLGGRAADVLGARRMFLAGLGIFTAASLASGLAPAAGVLIAARGAQGLGAALLSPAALAIITARYTGAQRATALATWGALGAGGAAVGVLAGGVLTSAFGWRSVFLINVPVGLAAALLSLRLVPRPAARLTRGGGRDLDLPGAVLAVAGLGTLILALAGTSSSGWGSARTILLLLLGAGLLAGFAAAERVAARPLLPRATWHSRPLVAGMAVMLGGTGILVGTFFLTTLYLQDALRASPLTAGAEFLPMVLAIGLAAHLAARLLPRVGARVLAVSGMLLMAGGGLLLATQAGAGYGTGVLPGLLVLGLGTGLVFPAATVSAMSRIRPGQEGLASGMVTTAHEVGAALGAAVFAALGAPATAGLAGLTAGYRHGFTVAAVIAAGLAVLAVFAVPPARPAAGERTSPH